MARCPGRDSLTLSLPARPLCWVAALFLLLAGAGHARAGYIMAGGLAPAAEAGALGTDPSITAADTGLPGGTYDAPDLDQNNPGPTSPDRLGPSGMAGGFSRTLAGLLRAGGSRSPTSSGPGGGSGPGNGLGRAATGLPDPQLVLTLCAASAAVTLPAPVDSIFKPPRISG